MKYAVIRTGGKQYRVQEGDIIEIERLPDPTGPIAFSDILFYTEGTISQVGQPTLAGVKVTGTILAETRGPKIRVSKFKAKARYRRTTGHRQALTKVQIEAIGTGAKKETKTPIESTSLEKPKRIARVAKKA